MPLTALVLTSLTLKRSHGEGKCAVKATPGADEQVLFFAVDGGSQSSSDLRQYLYGNANTMMCDCVVYYANPRVRTLCCVELKGSGDIDRAVDQVIATKRGLETDLIKTLAGRLKNTPLLWTAYVHRHGGSPSRHAETRLDKEFGSTARYRVLSNPDVGEFLRKLKV